MGRTTAAGLIAIVVVSTVFGLVLDPKPFVENLLAETAGAAASIFVGLTLVEYLIARQRSRDWARVSDQTTKAIHAHLMDIAFSFALILPPRQDDRTDFVSSYYQFDLPSTEAAQAIERIASYVRENKKQLGEVGDTHDVVVVEPGQDLVEEAKRHPKGAVFVFSQDETRRIHKASLDFASSRTMYLKASPHVQQLRDVLIARVLQFHDDPALAERLIEIETVEREWLANLEMIEDWGAPEEFGWESAAKLLNASAKVVEQLAKNVREQQTVDK